MIVVGRIYQRLRSTQSKYGLGFLLLDKVSCSVFNRNFALSSEVDTLRAQVQDLHRILHGHIADHVTKTSDGPSRPSEMHAYSSSSSIPQIATYTRDPEYHSAKEFEPTRLGDRQLEHSVSVLEDLVQGSGGQMEPVGNLNSTENPLDPSSLAQSQPSRLPRVLVRFTRNTYLIDSVFEILPEQHVQRQLLKCYLDGPLHQGWRVNIKRLRALIPLLIPPTAGDTCPFVYP